MKYKTIALRELDIDPADLRTALYCHWQMEKLEYHLDRMLSYMVENRLPHALTRLVIRDIEEARSELKEIFNDLYEMERGLD